MPTRYFTYRYSGSTQQVGPSSGKLYWFQQRIVTPVDDNNDAEYFLHLGSPESGVYSYRETDIAGTPIGPFPPIDMSKRVAMIDQRKFPTDKGMPPADEWRKVSEDLADPVLFYHKSRIKLRR